MTEVKHTPGPWFVTGNRTLYVEARIGGGLVQEVAACGPTHQDGGYGDQQKANARLISAAPDMLQRLEMCKRFLEDMHTQSPEVTVAASQTLHETVSEIIAQATGK